MTTAQDLVPGDVSAIDETVTSMTKLAKAFDAAGEGFKKIDTGKWQGKAADAFLEYFQQEPPKWIKAADAFDVSSKDLKSYRDVLDWAQRQAEHVINERERAERVTEQARAEYEAAAERGSAAPRPFSDPGASIRANADETLREAKQQLQEAAAKAARSLRDATAHAPPEPGLLTQLVDAAGDAFDMTTEVVGGLAQGAFHATLDLVKTVRMVSPFDPYNTTHPAEYASNMWGMGTGLAKAGWSVVTDPVGAVQDGVDAFQKGWNGFLDDPGNFVGRLAPDVALGAATGGAGTAVSLSAKAGREVLDAAGDLAKAGGRVDAPNSPGPDVSGQAPWTRGEWEGPSNQPPHGVDQGAGSRHDGGFGPQGSPESRGEVDPGGGSGGDPGSGPDQAPGHSPDGADTAEPEPSRPDSGGSSEPEPLNSQERYELSNMQERIRELQDRGIPNLSEPERAELQQLQRDSRPLLGRSHL